VTRAFSFRGAVAFAIGALVFVTPILLVGATLASVAAVFRFVLDAMETVCNDDYRT